MVPGSRVDHDNRNPSTVEIKVYHFSAVQAKSDTDFSSPPPDTSPSISDNAAEEGGGCFITTPTFASNMDRGVHASLRAAARYGLTPITWLGCMVLNIHPIALLFGFILLLCALARCLRRSAVSTRQSAIKY